MAKNIEGDNGKKGGSSPIADPTPKGSWSTIRDNSKAAPDAYSEEGNSQYISEFGGIANKISQVASQLKGGEKVSLSTISGFLGGVGNALSGITSTVDQVRSSLSGDNIFDKLSGIANISHSTLTQMGVNNLPNIADSLSRGREIYGNINNTLSRIRNTDFSKVSNLFGMVEELTGSDVFSLSKLGGQADYLTGLVRDIMDNDIPGSLHALKDIVKNNPYRDRIVKDVYPKAVDKQDLSSIRAMTDIVGPKKFNTLTSNPHQQGNFRNVLSSNWKKEHEYADRPTMEVYQDLKETLKKTSVDHDWLYTKRGNDLTINAKDYTSASERFKELFKKGCQVSNRIRVLTDEHINDSVKDEINADDNTRLDDEKFLIMLSLGGSSVKSAIKRDFGRVVIENNDIRINT